MFQSQVGMLMFLESRSKKTKNKSPAEKAMCPSFFDAVSAEMTKLPWL